ncbi:MAG: DUF177 domain-containing protein [Inquilinus sp.]|nr:DUF177 domain-containing protein [Inquilinus sp.]
MTGDTPEFSRVVGLDEIGDRPLIRSIEAEAGEREALARRFGLQSLDRLRAKLTLAPLRHGDVIVVEGTLVAEAVQTCVVTLGPVPVRIEEDFSVRLAPADEARPAVEVDPEVDEPEPLDGESIDIGEIVAQHFALALPPYPRAEGVQFDGAGVGSEEPTVAGPFAALERLKRR